MKSKFFLIGKKSMSLILTFMLIFSTMAVGIVTANAATDVTIYFTPQSSWITNNYTVKVNYKFANDDNNGWRLSDAAVDTGKTISGNKVYSASLSLDHGGVHAMQMQAYDSSNSFKGQDIIYASSATWYDSNTYNGKYWNGSSWVDPSWDSGSGDTPSTGITVYFKNTSSWSSVYCYAWEGGGTGDFPGKKMTKVVGTSDIYEISLTDSPANCIFSNGNSGDGNKTKDLTIQNGKMYNFSTGQWEDYTSGGDTPTTKYYIGGRFKTSTANTYAGEYDWDANSTNIPFVTTGTTGVYKVETGLTVADLSGSVNNRQHYFLISQKNGDTFTYYADNSKNQSFYNFQNNIGASNAITLTQLTDDTDEKKLIKFNKTDSTSTDLVTIWLDTTNGMKLYYTTDGGTTPTTTNKSEWIANQSDGLFIDANPSAEADADFSTLIKWNKKFSGNSGTTQSDGNYRFYVPKNVALSTAKVYNAFSTDVKLNDVTIPSKGSAEVNLTPGNIYPTEQGSVKVMQGSTDAMFFYTTKDGVKYDLPTVIDPSTYPKKGSVSTNGGTCTTMRNDTATPAFKSSMALSSVKGRGNSSWEASSQIFGKYAFNMKLKSATDLLGMARSTSYCLLANNVDEAMLRNAFTYSLAAAIGLYDSPEFRFVDIYDNGEYLGQYLVTEKVDVGEDKLINNTSIDKINKDAATADGGTLDETTNSGTYSFKKSDGTTVNPQMQYCTVGADPNFDTGTFLLEFEIDKRYTAEASWFISPKGQHVVVKSPEFATKRQVEYIAQKFAAMEEIAYDASSELSSLFGHIDLDSFARMYLIQELSANLDSAATSYYLTFDCAKGSDARFVASPVWDYDWAFGQYQTLAGNEDRHKSDINGNNMDSHDPEAWFAKNKAMGGGKATGKYSLQSALANHSKFQSVIKKVWNGSSNQDGFYKIVQTYYNNDGQLDKWKDKISASVAMNEARWGFIASDPATEWGSVDNADTFDANVNYLKTTWTSTRASWLDTEINNFTNYSQISSPDLQVFNGTSELTSGSSIDPNTALTFKASTKESFVTYELYDGNTKLDSNTTGEFTHTPTTSGVHNYSVKTVYNSTDRKESTPVRISLLSSELSVSLRSSNSTAVVGQSITLTADVTPAEGAYMYTYYSCDADGNNRTVVSSSSNKSSVSVTVPNAGANYYIVSVTNGTSTVTSNVVTVTATASTGEHTITVNFKGVKSALYTPTLYLNGASVGAMTVGTELGHSFSNTTKFCWYTAKITVDSSKDNTISFKNTRIGIDCSITDRFNNDTYYLAAKDMIADKNVIDLSGEDEYIRNFYHTARNMVYSADGQYDRTLGYTNIGGTSYRMGEWIDNNNPGVVSVKSATLAQMTAAGLANPDYVQACLLDTNMDKSVNVLDATMIQAAIVNE